MSNWGHESFLQVFIKQGSPGNFIFFNEILAFLKKIESGKVPKPLSLLDFTDFFSIATLGVVISRVSLGRVS